MRRYVYWSSAVAAGVLLDELAYWTITRLHGLSRRGLLDHARAALRI